MPVKLDLPTRFWRLVDQSAGPLACWPWLGYVNKPGKKMVRNSSRSGTNQVARPRFRILEQRLPDGTLFQHHEYAMPIALFLTDGVGIDERRAAGLEACHRPECANPLCVNPSHGYWGTADDNRRDRWGDRDATQLNPICPQILLD